MIVKTRPESKSIPPIDLGSIFKNESVYHYAIEGSFQRPMVWGQKQIGELLDEIIETVESNIKNCPDKVFNRYYSIIGNLDYSSLEPHNKALIEGAGVSPEDVKSIVDASQRVRTLLGLYLSLIVLSQSHTNGLFGEDDSTDGERLFSRFFTRDGNPKIMDIESSEFSVLIAKLQNNTADEILSKRKPEKQINRVFKDDSNEKTMEQVFEYCSYLLENYFKNHPEISIKDFTDIFLKNVVFYEEKFDPNLKFIRFVDQNSKGTPMSIDELMPKYMINQVSGADTERLYKAYLKFKKTAEECKDLKLCVPTKQRSCKEFIMGECHKIMLAEKVKSRNVRPAFKNEFGLKDFNFGIEVCINNKELYTTEDEVYEYFQLCYEMADFIKNHSMAFHNDPSLDTYMLKNYKQKQVWTYCIKPAFIALKYYDREARTKILRLIFSAYLIPEVLRKAIDNKSTQKWVDIFEELSYKLVTGRNNLMDVQLNELTGIVEKCRRSYASNFDWNKSSDVLTLMSYLTKSDILTNIMVLMEYDIRDRYGIDKRSLYESIMQSKDKKAKKGYTLDHWIPQNCLPTGDSNNDMLNRSLGQTIGNLVLLEKSLNSSKGDDQSSSYDNYMESKFIITKLMCKDSKMDLTQKEIEEISEYPYLIRYTKEEINNPTFDMIKTRAYRLASFLCDFIMRPLRYE